MSAVDGGNREANDFEVINGSNNMPGAAADAGSQGKEWLTKSIKELASASRTKQIAVGGGTGWACGYLSCKVGKSAAMAVGGSLLLLQIASHKGYITINWGKLERHYERTKREVQRDVQSKLPAMMEEVVDFVQENAVLATGFAGGFLIGLASA